MAARHSTTSRPANYQLKATRAMASLDVIRIAGLYPHLTFRDLGNGHCYTIGDEASLRALGLIKPYMHLPKKPHGYTESVRHCSSSDRWKISMVASGELSVRPFHVTFLDPAYQAFRMTCLGLSPAVLDGEPPEIY